MSIILSVSLCCKEIINIIKDISFLNILFHFVPKVVEVIVARQLRQVEMTLQDIDCVDSETVSTGQRLEYIRSAKV